MLVTLLGVNSNKTTLAGTIKYTYDAQGNTLSDGENTYLYDCLNRITEVKTKAGDIQKNHYDAEGLRSQMEENGKLVSFIYADREVITEEDEAGEHIRYIRGHELLASDSERARTYYHYACDEMGSITDITDCHGTVLNHYAYDAFGNRTVEEETVENRFGFAGEMMDAVTGQYYLRARFYNPVIARFLSEDTYYGDGLNLYAYCHNNPVGYVDPSGHIKKICSKKYGELKKKETEGGTLSEKEKRQIYEYEQNQKKSNGAGSDSKSGRNAGLKEFDIVPYGKFKDYPGDGLTGHELLQNAWLEANGKIPKRGVGLSTKNPAIALRENPIHKFISGQQKSLGLNKKNLAGTSWRKNVLDNIQILKDTGVPRDKIAELAWQTRKFAIDNGF